MARLKFSLLAWVFLRVQPPMTNRSKTATVRRAARFQCALRCAVLNFVPGIRTASVLRMSQEIPLCCATLLARAAKDSHKSVVTYGERSLKIHRGRVGPVGRGCDGSKHMISNSLEI